MNAQQAHEIALNNIGKTCDGLLPCIKKTIKEAANNGRFSCRFNLEPHLENNEIMHLTVSLLINILKTEDGFEVTHEQGSDQRENTSWNFLTIEW